MIWIALAACALVVFVLGMVAGIWLLEHELKRNGWRVRLQVHDDGERETT